MLWKKAKNDFFLKRNRKHRKRKSGNENILKNGKGMIGKNVVGYENQMFKNT